jgi:hypothetical protein
MRRHTLLALVALAAGCGWNNLPDGGHWYSGPLWDPAGVVAAEDGLYVPLPAAAGLAHVALDGTWAPIDLGGAQARDLVPLPGALGAVAFADRTWCDAEDPREARRQRDLRDCPADQRVTESEVVVLQDGAIQRRADVSSHLDTLAFSPSGSHAIAYLSGTGTTDLSGIVNLTEVEVLDLDAGTRAPVRVGFAANRVLFTDDGAAAVVLSQSAVAVVDLTAEPPVATVTFPLTLDPDDLVDPVGVDLTPDGAHALISVRGTGDLYVLDLVNPSVNIVSLAASPAAMHVDAGADETLLVYASSANLEVLDHVFFDSRTVALDEPMDRIVPGDGFALLHGARGQKDVYRYSYDSRDLIEYRLQNPALSVALAPGGEFAVALTGTEGSGGGGAEGFYDGRPGMEILDLRGDSDTTIPYALEGFGVGVAFDAREDGGVWALVLQRDVEYLWKGDLATGLSDTVRLDAPPLGIGALPTGGFYVTHADALGLITLYDPETDDTVTVGGFALAGALEQPQLAEVDE